MRFLSEPSNPLSLLFRNTHKRIQKNSFSQKSHFACQKLPVAQFAIEIQNLSVFELAK
jgi:hypothetical protein